MMRWLTSSSIQARLLVVSIAVGLIFFGTTQLSNTPLEIYPEFSPVYVEIQTEALGLSADEVEQLLTVALEQDLLNGIAFLDEIWSESMQGLSKVICVFESGTDPMKARQVVAERLTQAHALPNVSKPPIMLQPYSSTSRVLKISLSPATEEMSLIDMSVLARWTIQPYLMGIEGVANVSIWGQRKRQMQVQVNPETLRDNEVKLKEVIKTAGEALWVSPLTFLESSTPGTGGFFDTPNQRLGVRHVLPIQEPEDLGKVALYGHENMLLSDVTTVVENHQPLIGDAIINGKEGMMLVIEKFPWANTVEVTEKVETALAELKPGLVGINFDSDIYRPAAFIQASNANLSKRLLVGLGFGVVLLFLLFYHWRTALISVVSISLSLLVGTYVLFLNGVTFNMMVIAGLVLALGIIIDDAIVTMENIRRRLSQQRTVVGSTNTTADIILEATLEMRSPILFATFIVLLALIPLYFFGGITDKFLSPLASSYLTAILASLLVVITLVPALSMLLFSGNKEMNTKSPLMGFLQKTLGASAFKLGQKPAVTYGLLGALTLTSLLIFPNLNKDLLPPGIEMRDLVIEVDAPEGTSLTGMNQLVKKAIADLTQIAGVRNVVAHTGRAVMSDKVQNVNSGEIWMKIDDNVDYATTVADVKKTISGYEELSPSVQNYLNQSVNKSVRLSNHLYNVRAYGENQATLTKKAEEIKEAISDVNGISNVKVNYPPLEPVIEVEVNLESAREHEIKPGDVRRAAAILLAGVEVGSIFEGQKVFDVVVWGTPEIRDNLDDIENLLIDKPNGSHVRLGDVATVTTTQAPRVINRESVSRYMDISFDYAGTDHAVLAANIENSFDLVDFPLEYHAELTGDFKEIQDSNQQLAIIILVALIGMLLLFQAAFMSWRLAFVFLFSLLMALSGGMIAAMLIVGKLTLSVMVGLMAILGIASYQGVALFKHFKRLEIYEGVPFGAALIEQGTNDRFAPIITSTLITAVVFLPFLVFGKMPGLEMINPMSIVILGGLLTTLLLNIYVLPRLYLQFAPNSEASKAEEKAMLDYIPKKTAAAIVAQGKDFSFE